MFRPCAVHGGDQWSWTIAVTFIPVCHSIIEGFGLGIETRPDAWCTPSFQIDRNLLTATPRTWTLSLIFPGRRDLTLVRFQRGDVKDFPDRAGNSDHPERDFRRSRRAHSGHTFCHAYPAHPGNFRSSRQVRAQTGLHRAQPGGQYRNRPGTGSSPIRRHRSLQSGHPDRHQGRPRRDLAHRLPGRTVFSPDRVARNEHPRSPSARGHGDHVLAVHSGNTRAITRVINDLYRLSHGPLERVQAIHASDMPIRKNSKSCCTRSGPNFHPRARRIPTPVQTCRTGRGRGVAPERAFIVESGSPVTFSAAGIRLEDPICADSVLVDGKGVGDVGQSVLRERQILSGREWSSNAGPGRNRHHRLHQRPVKGFIFEQHFLTFWKTPNASCWMCWKQIGAEIAIGGPHPFGPAPLFPHRAGTRPGGYSLIVRV